MIIEDEGAMSAMTIGKRLVSVRYGARGIVIDNEGAMRVFTKK